MRCGAVQAAATARYPHSMELHHLCVFSPSHLQKTPTQLSPVTDALTVTFHFHLSPPLLSLPPFLPSSTSILHLLHLFCQIRRSQTLIPSPLPPLFFYTPKPRLPVPLPSRSRLDSTRPVRRLQIDPSPHLSATNLFQGSPSELSLLFVVSDAALLD